MNEMERSSDLEKQLLELKSQILESKTDDPTKVMTVEKEGKLGEDFSVEKEGELSEDLKVEKYGELSEDLRQRIEYHKDLILKHGDLNLTKKKLNLKIIFAERILERSRLISLEGDGSNEKISNFVKTLKKKLKKIEKKEALQNQELVASLQSLDQDFENLEPIFTYKVQNHLYRILMYN